MSNYWTIEDIDWDAFRPDLVDPQLLAVVKAASLVEANAPDYVTYLCNVFQDDAPLCKAIHQWGAEEEQHGETLARWAALADPGYDAEAALTLFRSDYQQVPLDTTESVRGSRGGELFARCIVESGTTSFYAAMHDATDEPVLKQIAQNISNDEVRHYTLFRRHLEDYEGEDKRSVLKRFKILTERIAETDDDEFGYAYHCANVAPVSDTPYDREQCSIAYENGAYGLYRRGHLEKGAKMMMRAMGFRPGSIPVKMALPVAWWIMRRKQQRLSRLAQAA